VAAGAGARVAKHGNKSISSRCGSSDLMSTLGVNIDASKKSMLKALKRTGFGYFHAPNYHPIFRQIQSVRLELGKKGIRSIFNLTGPLVNPLRPERQLIGVFRKDLALVLADATKELGFKHALIVWNWDGYDELTTISKSILIEVSGRRLKVKLFSPAKFNLRRCRKKDLRGGSPEVNRQIASNILKGLDLGPRRDNVLLNAAAILYVSGRAKDLKSGIKLAKRSLDSGAGSKIVADVSALSNDFR